MSAPASMADAGNGDPALLLKALSLKPKTGVLKVLKTIAEIKAKSETIDVLAVEISARHSSDVLNLIRDIVKDLNSVDVQHLKRVAKSNFLPGHVLKEFTTISNGVSETPNNTANQTDVVEATNIELETVADPRYVIVCPNHLITKEDFLNALMSHAPFANVNPPPKLVTLPVPAFAPTSSEQAKDWSQRYWPISYKNTNPYGPHPSLVQRAELEILPSSGMAFALAQHVANEASVLGYGPEIGCVIVDRTQSLSKEDTIVAVAGDARWCRETKEGPGNVMAHAVQRAIALVAQKRLRKEQAKDDDLHSRISSSTSQPTLSIEASVFQDIPLTSSESLVHEMDNLAGGGYLCTDLDIYITHEPCVMCSMAILHSRFQRCIFQKRMPLTGGLVADSGLQYGIFWRPAELNWKMLTWEWIEDENTDDETALDEKFHA